MNDQVAENIPQRLTIKQYLRRWYNRFKYWMYLNIWCSYLYRPTMRILHKFNLHYCPPSELQIEPYEPYRTYHKCDWCGLNGFTYNYTVIKQMIVDSPFNKDSISGSFSKTHEK